MKVLAVKSDNMISKPVTSIVKGENQLFNSYKLFSDLHMCDSHGIHTIQINKQIKTIKLELSI